MGPRAYVHVVYIFKPHQPATQTQNQHTPATHKNHALHCASTLHCASIHYRSLLLVKTKLLPVHTTHKKQFYIPVLHAYAYMGTCTPQGVFSQLTEISDLFTCFKTDRRQTDSTDTPCPSAAACIKPTSHIQQAT